MAILQTDPERFGCIEGQGDYSGPDAHTPHSTGMIGEMEKEAPKTPARGTGRKRGRPKGSGSGRGRASSKGASPSQSPKPVTIGSVLIRVPFFLSCSDVFVVVHIWLCSFLLLNATPSWIFSLILFMKENQFAKFVQCDVIKESCHSLVKIRFLFPSAALQRHQRLSVFSRSQENDDSFHFSSKPQSFGLFFHVFLFSLECLFNPHCILNMAPILDVYFKITSAEARSDGSGSEQTRLEVPPSLHHSNLNRAAVIAKAIKGSVKKDSAGVKDTLGRQKIQSGRGWHGHGRASQVEKLNGFLSW